MQCHFSDIIQVMREGVRWSSAKNIILELEFYVAFPKDAKYLYPLGRHYTLREFPNEPEWHSSWVAEITLSSHSRQALSNFQLDSLSRDNVHSVKVWNGDKDLIFRYVYAYPVETITARYDILPPCNDPSWFLPGGGAGIAPPQTATGLEKIDKAVIVRKRWLRQVDGQHGVEAKSSVAFEFITRQRMYSSEMVAVEP
ncbi:hypothetical protein B0H63DRAFT_454127 [Podospora didyma]|uniref:Uncharacterized protein n=1 Tax=Podospora didyma TaxID=330526 RepID=A0AAE0N3W1_9PEZI|nr:hypothetical protein B0H63DRAFT_454127 [Podospora didyma]